MRRFIIAVVIVGSVACGGSGTPSTPVTPTPTTPTPTAPANIAGSYNMTIVVSSACASLLTASDRQRTYQMSISQTGQTANGTLIGNVTGGLSGTVSGTSLTFFFQVVDVNANFSNLWAIGSSQGSATVSDSPTSFSGTLSGAVQTGSATCSATDHKVTFTKR